MSAGFSPNAELLAQIGQDGKLRVFETNSGRLKVEFIARQHLSTPYAVFTWFWQTSYSKRRRSDAQYSIVVSSPYGALTHFSISQNTSEYFEHKNTHITALDFHPVSGLISAHENHDIIVYNSNLQPRDKWQSGKLRVNAIKISEDGKFLFTASKMVKWWSIENKTLIKTFNACQGPIKYLEILENDFIAGAPSGESCVVVWKLDWTEETTPTSTLSLQDDAEFLSAPIIERLTPLSPNATATSPAITVLALTKSGQLQFHELPRNRSKKSKPIKSRATLIISNEDAKQLPILIAKFISENLVVIAYGNWTNFSCERVEMKFDEEVTCLVRKERKKERRDGVGKSKAVVEGEAEYIQDHTAAQKRLRTSSGSQIPLKDRLENLSITQEQTSAQKSLSTKNRAQLLVQGLNSRDRNILNDVFFTKDENLVKNTVAKLPVQAIAPLLREISALLLGKTHAGKTAVLWLEALLSQHSAHFLSLSNCAEQFSPILHHIDAKLRIFPEISKLKGRVGLITGQISQTIDDNKENDDEGVLVYQDPESSDEDADIQEEELQASSDENWEELSNSSNEERVENEESVSENEDSV